MNNEGVYVWHCPHCGEKFIKDRENQMLNAADDHLQECQRAPLLRGGQGRTEADIEDSYRIFAVTMWAVFALVAIAFALIFLTGCSAVKRHVAPADELRKIFQ
jgi:hypothetical protein